MARIPVSEFLKRSKAPMSIFGALHSQIASMFGKVQENLQDPKTNLETDLRHSQRPGQVENEDLDDEHSGEDFVAETKPAEMKEKK